MASTNRSASSELKDILDAAGTMIITTDLAGIVRIFNPASERLLGWNTREVVGRHTPALWHDPAEIAARAAELSHELGRAVSPGFEVFVAQALRQLNEPQQWTFIRKDGSRFPVQLVVSAIRDAAGTVTGYLGTAQDLTALVEAEQERDRFFSVSLDMLGIANTDGYFRRINPTFSRVLGWTEKEFLSRPFIEFVHPADQAATLREIEKLAAGTPTLHFENRYRCKDGSWRWVAWTCTPQSDGTLYAAGRDVMVLRQAEEELRQTQQDLAITLNSIGDAVMATDVARRITRMNPVAEQLTGWTQSEALGRSIEEIFRIIHEETRRPAVIPVDDVLATGTVHGLANHTVLISRDGTERPIADSAAPIRDAGGQITGVVLVFRDVAAERQFERELQQLNADLERRIDERTRTLAESERRLRNGSHILETLSSDASLEQTLDVIARSVETEDPSALCSILLLDESGKHLLHGAAPSLPDFYNQAIHGLEIGERVWSCGTAAATKRRAIADDIQTHPDWKNLLSLADKACLRSCWSEPILADAGQVLGTLAIYHREPRMPSEKDQERVQWAASFVRLAIERKQAQAKLIENERFNRATLDSLSAHVAVLDATGKIVATNQAWRNFAQANGISWQSAAEGTDYLAICDRAAANGATDAADATEAIRQTIAGERETWVHEYPCHTPDEQRWFYCRVTRFPANGAVHVVVSHENITAMKMAQEHLSFSLARYETLSRVSPVGISLFDANGKCVDVNRRWCEMTDLRREQALGDGCHAAIHPHDRDRFVRRWIAMLQDGQPFRSEHRLRPNNGDTAWVFCQAEPITNTLGEITGYIRTLTDVTEQKLTEQALRLLSSDLAKLSGVAFYEALAVHMAELVGCEVTAICSGVPGDPDRMVTLALFKDGAIQPNLDYSIVDTPCADVLERGSCMIPCEAQQQYPDGAFVVDKHVEAYVGVRMIGSAGQRLGHLAAMSRRPLRHPQRVEAVLKLCSLSVVAEMEQQVSERRFSDLFEFSPDAVVITDRDGIILQANRQVENVFGWTSCELMGQPVEVLMPPNLSGGHGSLRELYLQSPLPRAMGSGRSDLLGCRKDGSVFPVDISLSPMQTSEGPLVTAAVRDVTERQKVLKDLRSAAEELQAANAALEQERSQLARRVAERTAELTAANEQLIQASRFKNEFLASMSHELRTPINGVLGMNELLLKTPLTDKQREFIEASSTSGRVLLSLVNDVLDISKIEAGKLELALQDCDLEVMAFDAITMFSHSAKQKGVSLTCRLDPQTCVTMLCDENRLRQVLVNLLSNALKFTSRGSVILESKCVQRDKQRIVVRLAVTDTGVGIPEDKLSRLFSPYSQIDSSTTRHHGGTGLGLSISKQLTELMGGTIGVTSRLGVGSTFWVEIPFELVKAEVRSSQRKQILDGIKVLAVDGVDKERRQIADCLESWGCPFQHVDTLQEALASVAQAEAADHPFAVVLADCRLAIGDGFVHLQKLANCPNLQVIGLGASENNDTATNLRQLGLRHLLRDPIRPSALFDALTSVLSVNPPAASPDQESDSAAEKQLVMISGHILLAEDNSINQMFVRELLNHCDCTCDIANNGDEALVALKLKHYDLALMDCQMPEMDGFTATREIRRREAAGELPGRLPIIALTANALKGDRERCLEAGMDDYLSKPLQTAQLQTMLAKYLSRPPELPTVSSDDT